MSLGKKDFFYISNNSYDFLAEKSLPFYHEGHRVLIASLGFKKNQSMTVIDLGSGYGFTSEYILTHFPRVRVIAVDKFDEMLKIARVRLSHFTNRVKFIHSDNTDFLKSYSGQADAVVSSFCIHHQTENGKKKLFKLAFDILKPGGKFLMLDLTTFDDPYLRKIARRYTIDYMKANVYDNTYRKNWIHHWNKINIPHPADTMVRWMRKIGFKAETMLRNYEIALIFAKK